jgi:hypothetical protein
MNHLSQEREIAIKNLDKSEILLFEAALTLDKNRLRAQVAQITADEWEKVIPNFHFISTEAATFYKNAKKEKVGRLGKPVRLLELTASIFICLLSRQLLQEEGEIQKSSLYRQIYNLYPHRYKDSEAVKQTVNRALSRLSIPTKKEEQLDCIRAKLKVSSKYSHEHFDRLLKHFKMQMLKLSDEDWKQTRALANECTLAIFQLVKSQDLPDGLEACFRKRISHILTAFHNTQFSNATDNMAVLVKPEKNGLIYIDPQDFNPKVHGFSL